MDRPFARPGDWVRVTLEPDGCYASPGFDGTPENNVVTVVFTPPNGGTRNALVHKADCTGFDGSPEQAACQGQLGAGGRAFCIPVPNDTKTRLSVPNTFTIRFRFGDSDALLGLCNGGLNDNRLCTTNAQCGGGTCDRPTGVDDDLTLTGPATITVTEVGTPLACTATCAGKTGLSACIDDLHADTKCGSPVNATFPHFTALPPPNRYQDICTDPVPPCTGTRNDVRFAIDAAGNILMPVDWRGVLVGRVCLDGPNEGKPCVDDSSCAGAPCKIRGVPIPRFLRASSAVEAYPGRGAPILVPDLTVLRSYSPEGVELPPLFDPQGTPDATSTATFFGTADAPETVLRMARHNAPRKQCTGGANAGLPCVSNAQCPGGTCTPPLCVGGNQGLPCTTDADCVTGECGPGLFNFSTRLAGGVGPVLLRVGTCIGGTNAFAACTSNAQCPGGQCGSFSVAALDPAPLDGLNQTSVLNAFVMDESIENRPLNDDFDASDLVVKVGDRATGTYQPLVGAVDALSTFRVRDGNFSFPALAVEDDSVAFLESEWAENFSDLNGDGDRRDYVLRAVRLGEEAESYRPIVDAAPRIDGRSVVVSGGRAFYRRAESPSVGSVPELVSQTPGGLPADGDSSAGIVSTDGRWVAFDSVARDLVSPAEGTFTRDVFLRDRGNGMTARITNGGAFEYRVAAMSRNGQFVAYVDASISPSQAYLYDRVADTSELVSEIAGGGGVGGDSDSIPVQITDDGRYVVFFSGATDLVTGDANGAPDLFLRDRDALPPTTTRVSLGTGGAPLPDGATFGGQISADGRLVVFAGGDGQVYTHDRVTQNTAIVSVAAGGAAGDSISFTPKISADGRFVAFGSAATNLVPGDADGAIDVFVRDLAAGRTERASVATTFDAKPATLLDLAVDGRNVFFSAGTNDPDESELYVHDYLTDVTTQIMGQTDNSFGIPSADARFVPWAETQFPPNQSRMFVPGGVLPPEAFADGEYDDTVLEALDMTSGTATTLCPAGDVAVAAGRAAFLRPESATGTAACPNGSLNGGIDTLDDVVQLWPGSGSVLNLGRAATAVVLSDTTLAALVSEAQDAVNYNAHPGDTDMNDTVVQLHSAAGGGGWTNVGLAADEVAIAGDVVAFTVPEAAQGAGSLNSDVDPDDRVLHVHRIANGMTTNLGLAVLDFVVGETGLVAFRVSEAGQNGMSLNGDADADDGVLHVYDPGTGGVVNTGLAVLPCSLEACNPRLPYRVLKDTVRFLTLECDQGGGNLVGCLTGGTDLNEDGDAADLLLQVFNVEYPCTQPSCRALAATGAGVCTTTGRACVTDGNCTGGGRCFVPPGGCDRDLGTSCTTPTLSVPDSCAAGQYCRPFTNDPANGTCHVVEGPCSDVSDCDAGAVCNPGKKKGGRINAPVDDGGSKGSGTFTGIGHCVEDMQTPCAGPADCQSDEFCDDRDGGCKREHGVCKSAGDCPPDSDCQEDLTAATVEDQDGDEVPDALDNCPTVANVDQADADGNGLGDACDTTCAAVTGTRDKVTVKTANEIGLLRSKWEVSLAGYANEPVTVTLLDGDGVIATQDVGAVPAKGSTGKLWQYSTTADGLMQVRLRNLAPRKPGIFQVKTKAKRWFTAAAADEAAASTVLQVNVGSACFTQAATKKVD